MYVPKIPPYENLRYIILPQLTSQDLKKIFTAGIPHVSNWHFKLKHVSVYTMGNFFIVLIFFHPTPAFRESHLSQ